MAEQPKKKVGKYEILEELGRGAMGVVYRARDPFIGRLVALKTITPGLLDNPELLQRFYREAQAAGGLQHPNIVIIYDLGEADGLPYIAMEFLEGESLEKIIARQPAMPLGQKLNIILQLCRGLDYAHKHGVVHRDIKPANVIVMKDGTVKVVDFGIVRVSSTSMTSTGMVIGTVGYMSPEQAQAEHVDARSDLFSVGVVMYELFAYRKPFAGPNVAAVLIKIVTEEPPPLAQYAPQVPPQLCEIVHRCLHKNPNDRFLSLEDLCLELEPLTRALMRDMVEELVQQGKELLEKEEFPQARDRLRSALKIDSSHGLAKTLMAKISTEIRRLEIHPRVEKLVQEGQGLLQEGKYEEASQQFEAVLQIDTQHGQAKELLETARKEMARLAQVRRGLADSERALSHGDLTMAQAALSKVLELDRENPQAQALLEQLKDERELRGQRTRLQEALRQGRAHLIQQRYDDCVQLLEGLEKEFPQEEELNQLLQTAREGLEEQLKRQTVAAKTDEARSLLGRQNFKEALAVLDDLLKSYPKETGVVKLRHLVVQEEQDYARRQQYEQDRGRLREFIQKKDYAAALKLGEQLQKEFTDDTEISRLVASVRLEKQATERTAQLEELVESARKLIGAKKFDQAIREAEKALKKFPGEPALTELLATAKKSQEEQEKRAELERRVRAIKGAIERGELTDALDLGRQTLALAPEDTDVTQLINIAQREVEARDKKRQRDEKLKTALFHLESKDFDQATVVLRNVAKDFPFDDQVKSLLNAAEAREVPPDAATGVPSPAPSAENQYILQGPPAPAATPAAPTASTQPQPAPIAPPAIKPPRAPVPEIKPEAPLAAPAARPAAKAPPLPPVAVPAEVSVPLWKQPAGMAIGGVLVVVLLAGGYFGLVRGPAEPGMSETAVEQPATPMEQQQGLIDEAQKLADTGNYPGALAKLDEAQKIQGPLGNRITELRTQISQEVQNSELRNIRQQEAQIWSEAEGHFNANRFDQAESAFRRVLGLPQGGRRRADAQRYIQEVIPQRKKEESLFARAQTAAQQRDNESRLQDADQLLQQVIALKGPRQQEAVRLQNSVQQRLTQLAQEKGERERQQQIGALETQIRQDLRGENFLAARQKMEQIQRLQGNPGAINNEIDRGEQQKLNELEGKFNRARQQGNRAALEQLLGEFRNLAEAGGPVAARARSYANNQIPQALNDLEAAARRPETAARPAEAAARPSEVPPIPSLRRISCAVVPVAGSRYNRPVSAGSSMGQEFIDGGIVLNSSSNCGLPSDLIRGAREKSEVTVMVQIDEKGRVTGGRHLTGDAGVGQSVLQAAQQNWRFNPPRVNGIPVKTSAAVAVKF